MQKRAKRANQLVLFFLAGANFWEKHAKNTRKQAKSSAFLVLIFLWEKLVGANFYAFFNYAHQPPTGQMVDGYCENIQQIFDLTAHVLTTNHNVQPPLDGLPCRPLQPPRSQ